MADKLQGKQSRALVPLRAGDGGTPPPVGDVALGFSISFMGGRGVLTTRDRVWGPLGVKALALEIPQIAFPFDVTGGAERFKNRRCILRHLALSLDAEALQRILQQGELHTHGFGDLRVAIVDGCVELCGVFTLGGIPADFTCRVAILPSAPHEILWVFYDTRLYGWLPLPAALLPIYLQKALAFLPLANIRAGAWAMRPVERFVREVLPRGGWKVPDLQHAQLVAAEINRGQINIAAGPNDDPTRRQMIERAPPPHAVRAAEGMVTFPKAEEALAQGDMRAAYHIFRDALDDGRAGTFVRERLLQIGAADPELHLETRLLAEETLSRFPDDVAALLALGAMALHAKAHSEASSRYAALAELLRARKERYDMVAAETAAGRAAAPIDPAAALLAFERAAARSHDSRRLQAELFALRETTGDAAGAAEAGERWVVLESQPVQQAAVHCRLGYLYLSRLKDFKRARLHFERALRTQADHPEALEGLAETYAARGEPGRAATYLATLAEQAEASHNAERIAALNLRLGEIWQRWLHDPQSAAARYHRVLEVAPQHVQARLRLAQLAEAAGDLAKARGLYQDVIAMEDDLGEAFRPDLVTANTRLAQLILQHPGASAATAIAHLERAVELDPDHLPAREALLTLLRHSADWPRLVRVLDDVARRTVDVDDARRARLEAARIELQERGNRRAARQIYEHMLTTAPADVEALELLLPLLEGQNDSVALSQVLRRGADATLEPERRCDWLFRLSVVLQILRAPTPQQQSTLVEALDANPYHAGAARALVELVSQHNPTAALDAYDRLATAASTAQARGEAHLERAKLLGDSHVPQAIAAAHQATQESPQQVEAWALWADLLGRSDPSGARRLLESALPRFAGAAAALLQGRLSELCARSGDAAAEVQYLLALHHAEQVTGVQRQRLVQVLLEQKNLADAATWLERWAALPEAERHPDSAAALLQAAFLRQQLGELEAARAIIMQVLAQGGAHEAAAASQLEVLGRGRGDWADVLQALRTQLKYVAEAEQAPLLERLLDVLLQLRDLDAAEATATHLLQLQPQATPAHNLLAERQWERGAWESALEHYLYVLLVCPPEATSPGARRQIFVQAASLAAEVRPEKMQALTEAFAVQFAGERLEAPRLGEVLKRQQAWEPLLALRMVQLGKVTTRGGLPLRREVAEILHRRLGRPDAAAAYYQEVAAADPMDVDSRAALGEIFTSQGRFSELGKLYFGLSQLVDDPHLAVDYALQSAQLHADLLQDREAAQQIMRSLLDRGDIGVEQVRYAPLCNTLTALGMQSELAQLLENSLVADPNAHDGRLAELCDLLAGPLQDPGRALVWTERMIELFADDDSLRRRQVDLLWVAPHLGEAGEVLQAWAAVRQGPVRGEVLRELSSYQHTHGEEDAALLSLTEAAHLAASPLPLIDTLMERTMARGDWQAVATWADKAAELTPAGPLRDARLRRMIELATDYHPDVEAARAALLQLGERTAAETHLLANIYQESHDWAGLCALKEFAELPESVLWQGTRALAQHGELDLAQTYATELLRRGTDELAVWDYAAEIWRRAGKLSELAAWRLDWLATTRPASAAAHKLLAHAEMFESGNAAGVTRATVLMDLAAIELQERAGAWAVFQVARLLQENSWVDKAARALQSVLEEDDPRFITVLRARAQQEMDGGDADVAVALARQLVVLGDESAVDWLESALVQAGRKDELLELLKARAQFQADDAATLWTRIAGLHAERGAYKEAAHALLQVAAEARTKRWGELQYTVGREDNAPAMRAFGAQVCAQFSGDSEEKATWLWRAARDVWWELDKPQLARPLIQQAHALLPLDPAAVLAQAQAAPDQALRRLQEALVVCPTAALHHALGRLQLPHAAAHESFAAALGLAHDDAAELQALAATLRDAELNDLWVACCKRLYAIDSQAHAESYAACLRATGDTHALVQLWRDEAERQPAEAGAALLDEAAAVADQALGDRDLTLNLRAAALEKAPTPGRKQAALRCAIEAGAHAWVLMWAPDLVADHPAWLRPWLNAAMAENNAAVAQTVRALLVQKGSASDADKDAWVAGALQQGEGQALLESVQHDADLVRRILAQATAAADGPLIQSARVVWVAGGWGSVEDKLWVAQSRLHDAPAAAAVLLEQAANDGEAAHRGAHLFAAAVAWHQSGDAARAKDCLQGALQTGLVDAAAYTLALELLSGAARLDAAERLIAMQGEQGWPLPRRAALYEEVAAARLQQEDYSAAEALLRRAHAALGAGTRAWAQAMERALEAQDKRRALADLWLHQAPADAYDDSGWLRRLTAAAAVYQQAGVGLDELAALEALEARAPDAADDLRLLELAAENKDRERFAARVLRLAGDGQDGAAQVALARRAAPMWVRYFDDVPAALALMESALSHSLDAALLDAMGELYVRQSRALDFVAWLQRRSTSASGPAALGLLSRAADLAAAHDAPSQAYDLYRAALKLDAGLPHAMTFCLEYARRAGLWDDVAALLGQRAGLLQGEAALQSFVEAADIARQNLRDPAQEEAWLTAALQQAADGAVVARLVQLLLARNEAQAAAGWLEKNAVAESQALPLALQVADALQDATSLMEWICEHYPQAPRAVSYRLQRARAAGDLMALLQAIEARLEADELTPGQRAQLEDEAGDIAAQMRKPADAVHHWLAALDGPEVDMELLLKAYRVAAEDPALDQRVVQRAVAARQVLLWQLPDPEMPRRPLWAQLLARAYQEAGEPMEAVPYFEEAVAADPQDTASVHALGAIYTRTGQWDALGKLYEQLAQSHQGAARAELLHKAACLWRDRLVNESRAAELFAEALLVLPHYAPAQLDYGLLLARQSRFADALAHLEGRVDLTDPSTPQDHLFALLQCYRQQGFLAEAIDLAGAILARDPNHLEMLVARAEMLEEASRLHEAEAAWLEVLAARATAAPMEQAAVHRRLGRLAKRRGDVAQAVQHVEAAYAQEGDSPELVSELRQLYEAAERWSDAVSLRLREAALAEDDESAQISHYAALVQIYDTHLDDAPSGTAALEKIVNLTPRDPLLLRRLLDRYDVRAERAKFLLAAERLLSLNPAGDFDSAFYAKLAAAYEDVDVARAKDFYAKALVACEPGQLADLRQRHRELALKSGDYASYAASEDEAIAVLGDNAVKAARYAALADVYIKHLNDVPNTVVALAKACACAPSDERMWRRLADAYALEAGTYDKACELYRRLLAATPLDVDMLRIIARLEGQRGVTDRAYGYYACLLCLLPKDDEAQRFVDACRSARPLLPPRRLTDAETAQGLMHPRQPGPVEDLFAPLARFAELTHPGDLGKRGVTERDRIAADDARLPVLQKIAELLAVPAAVCYVHLGRGFACEMELLNPPVVLLGEAIVNAGHDRWLYFLAARAVELYRGGHALCERLSGTDLQALLAALCCAVDANAAPPGTGAATPRWTQTIAAPMTQQIRAAMAPRVAAYLKAAAQVDINRWRDATLATANRAAMVLTCDVEEAVTALLQARGFTDLGDSPRAEILQEAPEELDLFRFAQSETFFALRQGLGLALRKR